MGVNFCCQSFFHGLSVDVAVTLVVQQVVPGFKVMLFLLRVDTKIQHNKIRSGFGIDKPTLSFINDFPKAKADHRLKRIDYMQKPAPFCQISGQSHV